LPPFLKGQRRLWFRWWQWESHRFAYILPRVAIFLPFYLTQCLTKSERIKAFNRRTFRPWYNGKKDLYRYLNCKQYNDQGNIRLMIAADLAEAALLKVEQDEHRAIYGYYYVHLSRLYTAGKLKERQTYQQEVTDYKHLYKDEIGKLVFHVFHDIHPSWLISLAQGASIPDSEINAIKRRYKFKYE
jgi:hypothetical protein